jgi:adenosylcobyric acid synthase
LLNRAKAFALTGYEIHMGVTEHGAGASPLFEITSRNGTPCKVRDGASNSNGRIWGTYLHGIFDNDAFRHDFLNTLRQAKGLPVLSGTGIFYEQKLEESLDRLSETVLNALDMEAIMNIIDRGMA